MVRSLTSSQVTLQISPRHGCGDGETDQPVEWHDLKVVPLEIVYERFNFLVRRLPVTLVALSDETKAGEGNATEFNGLG